MESQSELLTIDELAQFLKVPKSWCYRATAARTIPFVRVGRHVRFVRADIREWLDANSGRAGDAPEVPNVHKDSDSHAIAGSRSNSHVQVGVGAHGPNGSEKTSGSETECNS